MSRFDKIAARLDAFGLDAMLVTSGPNRLYAAGFPSSAGLAVITKDGSWFFTDSRYIEAAGKAITGAEVRESTRENPASKQAAQILEKHGVKRLGYEEDYMTVGEYESLRKALPCEMVPATKLVMDLRSVKDQAEIDCLIAAQRIAEKALTETLNFIQVGRTEREIAAYLQYKMLSYGGEKMSFEPIVVSGPNSSMPHGVPSDKPVAAGDFITMDFGCVKYGYCSDMTRTVALGQVSDEQKAVYDTVLKAHLAVIDYVKPGVVCSDVDKVARDIIEKDYPGTFGHGLGHGVGFEIHEWPRFGRGDSTLAAEGMVVTDEPGIYLPAKYGVRIEDMLLVTADGCRSLTKSPKELICL